MRIVRTGLATVLAAAITTSAFAGDLGKSAESAAKEAAADTAHKSTGTPPSMWAGAALFAGGMGVGLYSFMHNKNGSFAEFGEASARDKKMGAAGLSAAFAGGLILFMGAHHAKQMPSIVIHRGGATVAKQISW